MGQYKTDTPFEVRRAESSKIISKFPSRIPLIVEPSGQSRHVPVIDKNKFLVPGDLTVGQFLFIIRRRMTLPSETALFLFIGGSLPTTSTLIREMYGTYKDDDGFLYAIYSGENTFGSSSGLIL